MSKKEEQHVTDNVAYGMSRNEIELSACDDVANQPSNGQLKMKNNTETRASDSNYTDDVPHPQLPSSVAYNVHTSTNVAYDLSGNRETESDIPTTTNERH